METRTIVLDAVITRLTDRLAVLKSRFEPTDGSGSDAAIRPLTYLHTDHLGKSVRATDTTGAVVWDGGVITPFGVQIATLGALTQPLLFPGQYQDAETGYAYNWHRTYAPDLGRYLQSDSIGLAGGTNYYAYVGGNPNRLAIIDCLLERGPISMVKEAQ